MVRLSRRLVQIVPEEVWPQSIDSAIFTPRSKNVYRTLVTYDGFGNRWDQTIQNGKAGVPMGVQFDQSKNRVSTAVYAYDANGNVTGMPGAGGISYDVDNRLLGMQREGSTEEYGYLADNKRFWKSAGGAET